MPLPQTANRVILDLCGGTGAWSRPYAEAGYIVHIIDLPTDIRLLPHPVKRIWGILAAPPCTYFCRMRMCRGRPTDEEFREGLSVVDACLRLVLLCQPVWWALENPQGYLKEWLGEPTFKFHPWEFGDPWTKRTWLWGSFVFPKKQLVTPNGSWVNKHTPHGQKAIAPNGMKAITPPGFAKAFFNANP